MNLKKMRRNLNYALASGWVRNGEIPQTTGWLRQRTRAKFGLPKGTPSADVLRRAQGKKPRNPIYTFGGRY